MRGISGKLVLILLCCALVVVTVVGSMEYHAGQRLITLQIEKDIAEISNRLGQSLRRPVYEFNRVAARDTILGEFANEGLEAVLVWSNKRAHFIAGLARQANGELAEASVIPQGDHLFHQRDIVKITPMNQEGQSVLVGEFDVVYNRHPLERKMLADLLLRQAKLGLTIILLLLILAEVVRRALVRPLEHIHKSVLLAEAAIADEKVDKDEIMAAMQLPVDVQKGSFRELSRMSAVFTKMVNTTFHRQNALLASEERYRELIEEAAVLVVKMDTDFICMYVNPIVEKLTGLTQQNAIGERAIEFIHPEDRKKTWKVLSNFTKGHSHTVNLENRVVHLNGQIKHMAWTIGIAYDYSGCPVYYRAIGRDITAEKQAEQKLMESEAYFRTVMQTCPDPIVLIRMDDGTILDVNDAGLETFGYSREGVQDGTTTLSLGLWQEASQRAVFVKELSENRQVDNMEITFLTADGRQLTGLVSSRAIEHKGQACHLSYFKDITVIKEATLALQESEGNYRKLSQEFEAVLDGIVDSLVLLGPEMKVLWGNRSAALQFGITQEELVGKTCHQLWRGEGEAVCDECIRAVFKTGQSTESMRKTADKRTWGVKGYPVFGRDGHVENVIQIASDLSEKVQLREEASWAAHLAALGGLSAGIAHEINNPTGLVLMAMPFVRDSVHEMLPVMDRHAEEHPDLTIAGIPYQMFREEILQTVEDVYGGAQRVKRIVEDLKDFARERTSDEVETVDINKMVKKSLRLLHNVVKNSTDNFIVEIDDDLPEVKGSSQRLEQVLVNLVQNACQALRTRSESVTLKVSLDSKRNKITIRVRDEGCGISPDIADKLTDPFFTTRREEGGTGLGLSVSARIIEEHDGTMNITSEPGQGTTFDIELPVADGA